MKKYLFNIFFKFIIINIMEKIDKELENFILSYKKLKEKYILLKNKYKELKKEYIDLEENIELNKKCLRLQTEIEELHTNLSMKNREELNLQDNINVYKKIIEDTIINQDLNKLKQEYEYIELLKKERKEIELGEDLINLFERNK